MPKTVKWNQSSQMLFVVLPAIVLFCVGFWILQSATASVPMESDDGVYDLTGVDLRYTMAELRRTVEYIPGELLSPEEFDARDDILVGKIPDGTRVATMRAMAKAYERERRAEAENEMLSEMNRLKSAFYTDMSHEMKTPLTVIAVNVQFAAQNIGAARWMKKR